MPANASFQGSTANSDAGDFPTTALASAGDDAHRIVDYSGVVDTQGVAYGFGDLQQLDIIPNGTIVDIASKN